jgi:arginase family enzyme
MLLRRLQKMAHSTIPTFAELGSTFLGIERRNADAEFVVAGIPYDIGTSNRTGQRFGPPVS